MSDVNKKRETHGDGSLTGTLAHTHTSRTLRKEKEEKSDDEAQGFTDDWNNMKKHERRQEREKNVCNTQKEETKHRTGGTEIYIFD